MDKSISDIGVIIARFQTPYLHEGHRFIIEAVRSKHNCAVIVLGISPEIGSSKNPLDYATREKMIKGVYRDLIVLPLIDHPSDIQWSSNLDALLVNTFPSSKFILYGSRDSFINHYSGVNQVEELPVKGAYNATVLREQTKACILNSEDFRKGVIYASSYKNVKILSSVDIAVFYNNKTNLLLERSNGKWQLLNQKPAPIDDSYERTAQCAVTEKVVNIKRDQIKYEGSFRTPIPTESEEVQVISSLFSTDLSRNELQHCKVRSGTGWFLLSRIEKMIEQNEVHSWHIPQLKKLISEYKTCDYERRQN